MRATKRTLLSCPLQSICFSVWETIPPKVHQKRKTWCLSHQKWVRTRKSVCSLVSMLSQMAWHEPSHFLDNSKWQYLHRKEEKGIFANHHHHTSSDNSMAIPPQKGGKRKICVFDTDNFLHFDFFRRCGGKWNKRMYELMGDYFEKEQGTDKRTK